MRFVVRSVAGVILFSLPLSSESFGQNPNPETVSPIWLQKALAIEREVRRANQTDLLSLWKDLRVHFKTFADDQIPAFKKAVIARLDRDYEILKTVKAEDKDGVIFATAIHELVGIRYERKGLLTQARDLLDQGEGMKLFNEGPEVFPEPPPDHYHEVAVMKVLLVYANAVAANEPNLTRYIRERQLYQKVQLLYAIRDRRIGPAVKKTTLVSQTAAGWSLELPNAGFVFGGKMVNGQCRGLDNGAFLQACRNATRFKPYHLACVWQYLFYKRRPPECDNLMGGDWSLSEQFTAVAPNEQPQPGDLVTAVNKVGEGGTFMYVKAVDGSPNEFMGIADSRIRDLYGRGNLDENLEGVHVFKHKLSADGVKVTVLRPKE